MKTLKKILIKKVFSEKEVELEQLLRERVCHPDYFWIIHRDFIYIGSKSSMIFNAEDIMKINEIRPITHIEIQNNHLILYRGLLAFPFNPDKFSDTELIKWNC